MRWDHECDVLVVGSGAGGLTAAVVAADNHADVLVIEKGACFGGTSASSGGVLWIPNSHLAQAAGAQDNDEDAVTYIRSVAGDDASEPLIRTYVAKAREMLKYMLDRSDLDYVSIPYPDYQSDRPGARKGYRNHDAVPLDGRLLGKDLELLERTHPANMLFGRYVWNTNDAAKLVTRSKGWVGALSRTLWRYYSDVGQRLRSSRSRYLTGGNALVARLKLSLDKRKVPIWTKTRLRELIIDDDGRVIGVIAERDGKRLSLLARRGVLLAAGGFERSAELRAKYLPRSPNPDWSGSQRNNTGDALLAAMKVGASTQRLDSAWFAPALHVPGEDRARPIFLERALPGAIIVNQAGRRYMNESADYHLAGTAMIDNNRPGAGTSPSFIIFDARFKWRYPMGPLMPMLPLWTHSKGVRSIVHKARTVAELARRLKIDPATLEATVERFNGQARASRDTDFHRGEETYDRLFGDPRIAGNPNLAPIEQAPFYAVAVFPGDIGTNGGLTIDEAGAVLGQDGRRIAGLYATGNITAAVMGRGYPGGGSTLGPAMTFGYLAARNMTGAN